MAPSIIGSKSIIEQLNIYKKDITDISESLMSSYNDAMSDKEIKFVDGLLNLLVGEVGAFMGVNAWATILVVLLKTSLAGLIAGFVFMPFKKSHPFVGCVLASCLVPIINTGLFVVGCLLFFMSLVEQYSAGTTMNSIQFIFIGFVGINFLIEFGVNAALSSGIYSIYKYREKKAMQN